MFHNINLQNFNACTFTKHEKVCTYKIMCFVRNIWYPIIIMGHRCLAHNNNWIPDISYKTHNLVFRLWAKCLKSLITGTTQWEII